MNLNYEHEIASSELQRGSVFQNLRSEATIRAHFIAEKIKPWLRKPTISRSQGVSLATMGLTGAGAATVLFMEDTRPALADSIVDTRFMQDGSEEDIEASDPDQDSAKVTNEAPPAIPVSEDIFCVEQGTGRWISENPDCGDAPIDEERNPGAFVAPAISAAPAAAPNECAPHGSRYNPELWNCKKPANAPQPNLPRLYWGREVNKPFCAYSPVHPSQRNARDNYIAVGEGRAIPQGEAWHMGIFYNGQTPQPGEQGHISVMWADFNEKNSEGGRVWHDVLSVRKDDGKNSFNFWSLDPRQPINDYTFFRKDGGVTQPLRSGWHYIQLYAYTPNGQQIRRAETTCTVGNPNQTYEPVRPNMPGGPPKEIGNPTS